MLSSVSPADPFPVPGAERRTETCGDLDIRIDRNGTWYYHGSPIGRKELVCLFASVLERDALGDYWLVTPAEAGRITVEDVPFVAVELYHCQSGREQVISLRTNVDEVVTVDAEHPLRVETRPDTGEPVPYVMVRDGLEARLTRAVYYQLVELGHGEKRPDGEFWGVWSMGRFFRLGELDGQG